MWAIDADRKRGVYYRKKLHQAITVREVQSLAFNCWAHEELCFSSANSSYSHGSK